VLERAFFRDGGGMSQYAAGRDIDPAGAMARRCASGRPTFRKITSAQYAKKLGQENYCVQPGE